MSQICPKLCIFRVKGKSQFLRPNIKLIFLNTISLSECMNFGYEHILNSTCHTMKVHNSFYATTYTFCSQQTNSSQFSNFNTTERRGQIATFSSFPPTNIIYYKNAPKNHPLSTLNAKSRIAYKIVY